jgi:hypothetical protein
MSSNIQVFWKLTMLFIIRDRGTRHQKTHTPCRSHQHNVFRALRKKKAYQITMSSLFKPFNQVSEFDKICTASFSIVKPTRRTISQIYFILEQHSICFGRSVRPSSGVYDCTYIIRYMSHRCCGYLLTRSHKTCIVWCRMYSLRPWWWTERPSETCRALFQNKINLRYCASGWFYYGNILQCTVLQTSNLQSFDVCLSVHRCIYVEKKTN